METTFNIYADADADYNQFTETYLTNVAKELNENCEHKNTPNTEGYYNFTKYEWERDNLSLDINDCKSKCYLENEYSCYQYSGLCNNCKTIIEKRISIPFNRTKVEMNLELNKMNMKLEKLNTNIKKIHETFNDHIHKLDIVLEKLGITTTDLNLNLEITDD